MHQWSVAGYPFRQKNLLRIIYERLTKIFDTELWYKTQKIYTVTDNGSKNYTAHKPKKNQNPVKQHNLLRKSSR